MDKIRATFEILIGLSAVDGEVDARELEVVAEFLNAHVGQVDFDPNQAIKDLISLTPAGLIEQVAFAAATIKASCSPSERLTIMKFGLELIAADGVLDENEKTLFNILAEAWGIDLAQFIQNMKS